MQHLYLEKQTGLIIDATKIKSKISTLRQKKNDDIYITWSYYSIGWFLYSAVFIWIFQMEKSDKYNYLKYAAQQQTYS